MSNSVQRVDLRIPDNIYSKIEQIAISTNQPFTPKSKNTDNPKPVLTHVINRLIEVGLKSVSQQDLEGLQKEELKLAELNPIDSQQIERNLLAKLEDKLEQLIETKINTAEIEKNLLAQLEGKINQITSNQDTVIINHDNHNKQSDNISDDSEIELPIDENEFKLESIFFNETDDGFTFEDTLNEIRRLHSQELSNHQIAKRLTEGNYPTKKGKYTWQGNQVERILHFLRKFSNQ